MQKIIFSSLIIWLIALTAFASSKTPATHPPETTKRAIQAPEFPDFPSTEFSVWDNMDESRAFEFKKLKEWLQANKNKLASQWSQFSDEGKALVLGCRMIVSPSWLDYTTSWIVQSKSWKMKRIVQKRLFQCKMNKVFNYLNWLIGPKEETFRLVDPKDLGITREELELYARRLGACTQADESE